MKSIVVFVAAVAISLAAAMHRFRDSGHAIGLLGSNGGKVRHAVQLGPGRRQYVVVVTGRVLPPWRGDARVVVESEAPSDYEVHLAEPAVRLGVWSRPRLVEQVLTGLKPKDRFALWVVLRPREPGRPSEGDAPPADSTVAFYDTETGQSLLRVPVIYHPEKEIGHAEDE